MVFKNRVKKIQATGYNEFHTVITIVFTRNSKIGVILLPLWFYMKQQQQCALKHHSGVGKKRYRCCHRNHHHSRLSYHALQDVGYNGLHTVIAIVFTRNSKIGVILQPLWFYMKQQQCALKHHRGGVGKKRYRCCRRNRRTVGQIRQKCK